MNTFWGKFILIKQSCKILNYEFIKIYPFELLIECVVNLKVASHARLCHFANGFNFLVELFAHGPDVSSSSSSEKMLELCYIKSAGLFYLISLGFLTIGTFWALKLMKYIKNNYMRTFCLTVRLAKYVLLNGYFSCNYAFILLIMISNTSHVSKLVWILEVQIKYI